MNVLDHHTLPLFVCVCAVAGATYAQCSVTPTDSDGDCIPNSVEDALLSALEPVWVPGETQQPPPQNIGWMLPHGYIQWRDAGVGGQWTGRYPALNASAPLAGFISTLRNHVSQGRAYEYQFAYFDNQFRYSEDGADTLTWARCVTESRGVYGRVWQPSGAAANEYSVQYFMHFGWNETDTPSGCDAGNHEGDWIGVDFDVDATSITQPRIIRAVYHNHGRQIIVQSPAGLLFSGTHPHVYLERGTNETWPNAGDHGFYGDEPPPLITTNRRLEAAGCTGEHTTHCNQGYTAVRQHWGSGGEYRITARNLGELGADAIDPVYNFILEYPGMYGSWWSSGCWIFDFLDTHSPEGPPYGSNGNKIWRRQSWSWGGPFDWTNFAEQATVYANPTAPRQGGNGSSAMPVRGLSGALPLTMSGGTIMLSPGTYSEMPMTIRNAVTLVANGGPVTISP